MDMEKIRIAVVDTYGGTRIGEVDKGSCVCDAINFLVNGEKVASDYILQKGDTVELMYRWGKGAGLAGIYRERGER